jgi:hypothetical protein
LKNKSVTKDTIFMRFLHRKVLLIEDNLAKRKWEGCKKCCFCDQDNSIQQICLFHLPSLNWCGSISKEKKIGSLAAAA